jgi:hypothetical protein
VIWWAVDFDGNFTIYRDLHLENHTMEMLDDRIRELEEAAGEWWTDDGWTREIADRGSKIIGVLGPASAWGDEDGLSAARTSRGHGLTWRRASDDLKSAVNEVRTRLIRRLLPKGAAKDDPGIPAVRYFKTCAASIEGVPSMMADKTDPDLPESKSDASAFRALCYAAMSRPMTPEKKKPRDDDWENAPKPKAARASRTGIPGSW